MKRPRKPRPGELVIVEATDMREPVTLTPAVRYDLMQLFFAVKSVEAQHGLPSGSIDDSPQEAIERIFAGDADHTPHPLPRIIHNGHKHNGNSDVSPVSGRLVAALATDTAEVAVVPLRTAEDLAPYNGVADIPGQPLHQAGTLHA